MAPRLFLGNFDFEYRLAEPSHEPSGKLRRLNAELATSWLAIAEDGDFLWTPAPIDPSFFQQIATAGMPRVIPVTSLDHLPADIECIPWGWSQEIYQLAAQRKWDITAPPLESVRISNSRATSNRLEQEWNVGLSAAGEVSSIDELTTRIESLPSPADRWVVKAEFGMSARERIIGHGALLPSDENWVRRRFASGKSVYFEPWVNRIDEFGIQLDVPITGEPVVVGITPMLVNERGQYAGSWFQFPESRFSCSVPYWHDATNIALRAAKVLQSQGYFGPLGIDAMIYSDSKGERQLRPLQDINARWTMGRLSLGLRRFCQKGEEGVWCHGPIPTSLGDLTHRQRPTSPELVGTMTCHHRSTAVFGFPRESTG